MLYQNRIAEFEPQIAAILARLVHHIHPDVVALVQERNLSERPFFVELLGELVDLDEYLFEGSACVFPGVRRYVSGRGERKTYSHEYRAIIDDNTFPRHLWTFLAGGKSYNGPSWKATGLSDFELAHVFTHKQTELEVERRFFMSVDNALEPSGDFTCACNTVLLPKGTVRPTDNSVAIKAVFYQRYIDLYGETPLRGRSGFRSDAVPVWYGDLEWNEPELPTDWKSKTARLLDYRRKRTLELVRAI